MRKLLKKMSLLLCFVLIIEITCSNSSCKVAAATNDTDFTKYLTWGFDMVTSPDVNKDTVKSVPILDENKLAKLKGNNWYTSKVGNNAFTYKVYVEETKSELEKSVITDSGAGFTIGSAGFSANVTTNRTQQKFSNDYWGKVVATSTYKQYASTLYDSELESCLSDAFVNAVKAGDYEKVFQRFGTHLVQKVTLGGKLVVDFHTNETSKMTKSEVKASANGSFLCLKGNTSVTYTNALKEFTTNCDYSISGMGGNISSIPATFNRTNEYATWINSVPSDPALYQVGDCIPIWELFSDATISKNLEKAYYQYFNKKLTSLRNSIPFVTDMRVHVGGYNVDSTLTDGEKVAKTDASRNYQNSDLNRGAGGKFVYLVYNTGNTQSKKITDVLVNCSNKNTSTPVKTGYVHVNGDLNAGAGGKWIFLNYKRQYNTNFTGFQSFCTRNVAETTSSNWVPIKDVNGNYVDLNKGAGGDYIYLFGYIDPLFEKIDTQIAANNAAISKLG